MTVGVGVPRPLPPAGPLGQVPAQRHRTPGQWARLKLLIDLRCAELANALGLTWRLLSLKRVLVIAAAALGVTLPAAGYGFARIFALLSTDVPAPALLVPLMTSLAFLSGLGLFFAETLGRYRNAVSGHPNRAYFRALDIPATLVHTVYVVPRLLGGTAFWVLLGAGVIAGLLSVPSRPGWLPAAAAGMVLQPLLWLAGTQLVSLRLAGNSAATGVSFRAGFSAAALVGACSGLLLSWVVLPRLRLDGRVPQASADLPGQELGPTLAVLLALLNLVLAALCWSQFRRLRSRSFRLDARGTVSRPVRSGRSPGWHWFRLLMNQRQRSWRKRVEDRLGWLLSGTVCAVATVRLTGAADLAGWGTPPAAAAGNIVLAAGFGSALLGLACAETTLSDLGRRVYGGAFRAALEVGAPLRTAVAVHLATLLAPTVLLGSLAATLTSLLLERIEVIPLVVAVGACAGSIIAERLFPPPRTVDGAAGESLATAMAALILGGVPVLWMLATPSLAILLTPISATALLGGALWCAHRNLTVL
jgi:hypothetical protein